jgi:hypothetical protein
MVNIRKKRVAMTKQLKRDVFTGCLLVRVPRGILPVGSFKAVGEHFEIDPKTVGKLWKSTMIQVNGYQPNLPIDPPFILANLPATVFDTKFKNAGQKPQYEPEQVLREIEIIDPNKRRSVRSLAGALGISKSSIGGLTLLWIERNTSG